MNNNRQGKVFIEIKESIYNTFGYIENFYMGSFDEFKVHTGYEEIDHLISGLHCGDLITVVGGPGSGKSTFLANIAMNVAMRSKLEVVFVGLQHTSEQLGFMFMAKESNVVMGEVIRGYMRKEDVHELASKASRIAESPLTVTDVSVRNAEHLMDGLRNLKQAKPKIKLLIVDSLEMLPIHSKQEYAEYFRLLKRAALDIRLPILVSCSATTKHLKKSKKIKMSDTKFDIIRRYSDTVMLLELDTSNIDVHIMPHSPYLSNEFDDGVHLLNKIRAEVSLLKNSYGPTGSIFLNFIPQQYKFESIKGSSEQD